MKKLQPNLKKEWDFIVKSHTNFVGKQFDIIQRELWYIMQVLLREIDSSKSEYETSFRWGIYHLTKAHYIKTYC